jgi:UDP-3-O-[3-hydroxymyristoyl] glucosamine N-acyltransferase
VIIVLFNEVPQQVSMDLYIRELTQKLVHFPHLGKVMIGNDVDIGAYCSIARGSVSNTIIERDQN